MAKKSDDTKSAPAKAYCSPSKVLTDRSVRRSPNKIGKTIASPDSKAAKIKRNTTVIRIAQTKMYGTQIIQTAKVHDKGDDGFNYPIHKAIENGEPWATDHKLFFSGKVRETPERDCAATNTTNNYLRRSFVRMDSDATEYPTKAELKGFAQEVADVSSDTSYILLLYFLF